MGNTAGRRQTVAEERSGELSCGDWDDYVVVSPLLVQATQPNEEGETSQRAMEDSIDSGYEEPNQSTHSDRRQQHDKAEVGVLIVANCC